MAYKRAVSRPISTSDLKIIVMTRELIDRSFTLLKECPQPDTFLGRETYKPFPMQTEEDNIGDSNGNSAQASSPDE